MKGHNMSDEVRTADGELIEVGGAVYAEGVGKYEHIFVGEVKSISGVDGDVDEYGRPFMICPKVEVQWQNYDCELEVVDTVMVYGGGGEVFEAEELYADRQLLEDQMDAAADDARGIHDGLGAG